MAVGQRRGKLHASHLARMDRIRREFWQSYRPRQEIEAYREQIVANQARAEKANELRRLEGFLANSSRHSRIEYLTGERRKMWQQLNVADSSGLM